VCEVCKEIEGKTLDKALVIIGSQPNYTPHLKAVVDALMDESMGIEKDPDKELDSEWEIRYRSGRR
jgi:hypothetical protein